MRIAVEGCCHGELDRIYASIKHLQRVENITVDLLLICGDFQSIRNSADLGVLACPDKYRAVGTFYQYYTGEKKAPVPTIFIGGNHEASSYLWELFHGGWVAPNIYFLGFAGVINFGGLRISGLSGIYKKHDYDAGYYETQPFNDAHSRSVYHVRKFNVYRLAQISKPIDIMLSHDWPRGIAFHGNTRALLQMKPFLGGEINTNTLGSYPNEFLLKRLRPSYWFAAHLHVKFAAIYRHDSGDAPQAPRPEESLTTSAMEDVENPDEIDIASDVEDDPQTADVKMVVEGVAALDEDNETEKIIEPPTNLAHNEAITPDVALSSIVDSPTQETEAPPSHSDPSHTPGVPEDASGSHSQEKPSTDIKQHASYTKFLALDKCLPGHDFLQVVDIPEVNGPMEFTYDEEWLAIVRATHDLFSLSSEQKKVPEDAEIARRIAEELEWVHEHITGIDDGLRIPQNFAMTAPAYISGQQSSRKKTKPAPPYLNPQTVRFCELLNLPNMINVDGLPPGASQTSGPAGNEVAEVLEATGDSSLTHDSLDDDVSQQPESLPLLEEHEDRDVDGDEEENDDTEIGADYISLEATNGMTGVDSPKTYEDDELTTETSGEHQTVVSIIREELDTISTEHINEES
ncbi:hypothetical protein SpCBS45565_g01870 [Spizellomyces sp. 'palustris']|nr:hypothetical protein SpCBS45565_g01870 [Spizellomyces sp. 'palustris']